MKLKLLHRLIIHVVLKCKNTMATEKRKKNKISKWYISPTQYPNEFLAVKTMKTVNYEVP